jgi:predicted O-methyltransferase YrrM
MSSQIISLTLKNLKKIGLEREIPNITEQNAEFLKNLISEKKPKHILEIGTANGYSSLHFVTVTPNDSDITTIEQAWNMHIDAITNFKNCKIKNIHAIWWDAKTTIPSLADSFFDFIYIDAMKKEYLQYLLLILPKMTKDAMIVIDDVVKFRDKMEDLYDFLDRNHIEYNICSTDPDDGIMIINASSLWKI